MTICPHVRFVQDSDGGVVLDIKADRFFSLNPTAAWIWTLLSTGNSISSTAETIAQKTDAEISVIERDIETLLDELAQRKLIDPS